MLEGHGGREGQRGFAVSVLLGSADGAGFSHCPQPDLEQRENAYSFFKDKTALQRDRPPRGPEAQGDMFSDTCRAEQ